MERRNDTPPSYTGLSQYPATPYGDGGDQSFNGPTMPPPSGSSLAPLPQCYQIPPTDQPSQYGSQNFIPRPSSPAWSMLSPSSSSLFSSPPVSPSSFRCSPPATAANKGMELLPQIPYMMRNSSSSSSAGSGLPPSEAHSSDNDIVSRLNSLLAAPSNHQRTYPRPVEMPVGARSQKRSRGESSWSHRDVNVDHVVPNGNTRRAAGSEIEPQSRTWRSVYPDGNLNVSHDEPSPLLPPQGVSVGVGNDIAYRGGFTPYQLSQIAACDKFKERAKYDPKGLKRLLSNREAAARSREKKALHQSQLELKVQILETQLSKLTAELELVKRERMAAHDECVRLRIRLDGKEEHGRLREALIEQLSGELRREREEASREREEANREREESSRQREEISRLREEVSEYRRRESERMNANMLGQVNMNQQFQEMPPQTYYNFD